MSLRDDNEGLAATAVGNGDLNKPTQQINVNEKNQWQWIDEFAHGLM